MYDFYHCRQNDTTFPSYRGRWNEIIFPYAQQQNGDFKPKDAEMLFGKPPTDENSDAMFEDLDLNKDGEVR